MELVGYICKNRECGKCKIHEILDTSGINAGQLLLKQEHNWSGNFYVFTDGLKQSTVITRETSENVPNLGYALVHTCEFYGIGDVIWKIGKELKKYSKDVECTPKDFSGIVFKDGIKRPIAVLD